MAGGLLFDCCPTSLDILAISGSAAAAGSVGRVALAVVCEVLFENVSIRPAPARQW